MAELTFEKALEKLEAIVAQLEKGSVPLEKSMKLYEEGVALAAQCEKKLKAARLKLSELSPEEEEADA